MRFDHLRDREPHAWERAVHLDKVTALLEPFDGIDVSARQPAAIE
ncbi:MULTISPECIES: hypothetical protein [unclassified Pseudonocardia]|nr:MULTISPECIES: hypothetical protein [unclassified Pseudonocardia]